MAETEITVEEKNKKNNISSVKKHLLLRKFTPTNIYCTVE